MNPMRQIRIEKLTFNFGSGKEQPKLEKGMLLIKHVTGMEPVKTITNKRIPSWGLRPGLPVGCKLTVRGAKVNELLPKLLEARKNSLPDTCFDDDGNISFGLPEYIDIPGVEYEPKLGIMGFEVCVTLSRPGYRIKKRRQKIAPVGPKHKIKKEDAIRFMENEFKIKVKNDLQ